MEGNVPLLKLNTGAVVPALGFGSGTRRDVDEIKAAVLRAVELGYRHFDTASAYVTEPAIGEGLAEAFKLGLVRREEVFVTSKLGNGDHDEEDVLPALRNTLSNLKLEHLDLYLIHGPTKMKKGAGFPPKEDDFLPLDLKSTWRGMERCVNEGLTKAIGVSNFTVKKLQDLLEYAEVVPAANQVELHPVWQQKKLREYCSTVGIQVFAWSPLGGLGKPWGSESVLEDPVIKELAVKHQRTPSQIILRWVTEQGVGAIVKSYNSERLLQNIKSFDFHLSKEDHHKIANIPQRRLAVWEFVCNSTTSPYKSPEELWDGEL